MTQAEIDARPTLDRVGLEAEPSWRYYKRDDSEYELPEHWTPEHVMHRMVEAYKILSRVRGRTTPAGYGSGWPEHLYDQSDVAGRRYPAPGEDEAECKLRLASDRDFESARLNPTPEPDEYSRMEEAFGWPGRYLLNEAEIILTRWALRRFRGRDAGREPIQAVFDQAITVARGLRRDFVLVR